MTVLLLLLFFPAVVDILLKGTLLYILHKYIYTYNVITSGMGSANLCSIYVLGTLLPCRTGFTAPSTPSSWKTNTMN